MSLPFEVLVPHIFSQIQEKQSSWIRDAPTDDDLDAVREAGQGDSVYDTLGLRSSLFHALEEGTAQLHCHVLVGSSIKAKVLVVAPRGYTPNIPWKLWLRIFHAFGKCQKKDSWRVVLYASNAKRRFPPKGQQPQQEHVNGGYAIPNDPSSIVIYREEECTRVLVHELLHACGSDHFGNSEPIREVLTESWAEVFLVALLANGSLQKAKRLWKIQSQWIADQEVQLRTHHNVQSPSDYAWRYTVGRRDVLTNLGFTIPQGNMSNLTSLRFTSPELGV